MHSRDTNDSRLLAVIAIEASVVQREERQLTEYPGVRLRTLAKVYTEDGGANPPAGTTKQFLKFWFARST